MNDIGLKIRTILTGIAGLPSDADADADLYLDLGVASFHALQLLQELEESFSVGIPDDQFVEATSLNKLTSMMSNLITVQASGR
jgi:acyl carrier protein